MKKAGEEIIIWFSESQLPRAREKRALVHFLLALFMKKKNLPDFRFGRTYSLLMIVMLYQEYGNHGIGSQEGDFSSNAR